MSSVVIVHTDPRSTIEFLRAAGFVVEVAGELTVPAYDPMGNGGRGFQDPPVRHVLIVSEAREMAA